MIPRNFINSSNAIVAIRFLLNIDIDAVDEKFLHIGITNLIDLPHTKQLFFYARYGDEMFSQKIEELVSHAITLTGLLNDEAKNNLVEFLALNQSY